MVVDLLRLGFQTRDEMSCDTAVRLGTGTVTSWSLRLRERLRGDEMEGRL